MDAPLLSRSLKVQLILEVARRVEAEADRLAMVPAEVWCSQNWAQLREGDWDGARRLREAMAIAEAKGYNLTAHREALEVVQTTYRWVLARHMAHRNH